MRRVGTVACAMRWGSSLLPFTGSTIIMDTQLIRRLPTCHRQQCSSSLLVSMQRHCVHRHRASLIRRVCCAAQPSPTKYAIIGAGLAGMATAWHLLNEHSQRCQHTPIEVHVFEAWGIGSGGSGAAAGLLHPITPKGKVLWKGEEAFGSALQLVAAAQQAAHSAQCTAGSAQPETFVWRAGMVRPAATSKQAAGFAKLPTSSTSTQSPGAGATTTQSPGAGATSTQSPGERATSAVAVNVLSKEQLQQLVPGIQVPALSESVASQHPPTDAQSSGNPASHSPEAPQHISKPLPRRLRRAAAAKGGGVMAADGGSDGVRSVLDLEQCAGLHVPSGVVLDVHQYLNAVWAACVQKAGTLAPGSTAVMHVQHVPSLAHLGTGSQGLQGSTAGWDGIVVAAGAAAGALPEIAAAAVPLQLCQGYTLVMRPPAASTATSPTTSPTTSSTADGYPPNSPSILGSTYLAAQGPQQLVVGATKNYQITPDEALQIGQPARRVPWDVHTRHTTTRTTTGSAADAVADATTQLVDEAARVWPPVKDWHVRQVRSGVRALPPRTAAGSLPLLGKLTLPDTEQPAPQTGDAASAQQQGQQLPPVWVVLGLGSRGLVYHSWISQQLAQAIVTGDESCIQPELLAWQALAQSNKPVVFEGA